MAEWSPGYILPETLTGHAVKQVCFDIPDVAEYRQAFWGRIWELGEEVQWAKDDPEDDKPRIAAEYWRQVLWETYQRYLASENCDTDDCKSYSPGAPFIQWFPNDPYNTPGLVPAGYNSPPWYLATPASNIALGSSTGDVITSIDRFPPGSLPTIIPSSGLPRFRVNVSGEGIITLHLVNLVAGSLIQLTKDDDILSVKFIDVSRDLVSIPPETMDAFQVQVEFTTPGLHWVDCIVVSWVNSSIPFLHHGGGLRQVDLCGFTDMPLVPPTMIRADPSGCGNLEKSTDGGDTWTDIPDTDFVRRDGVCAMSGGLEIYPTANQVLLTMKGTGSPYQAAKIMVVQDGAGVDRAWINPRGDIHANANATSQALILESGSMLLQNGTHIQFKDGSGNAQVALAAFNGTTILQSAGGGMQFRSFDGFQRANINEAGVFEVRTTAPAGVTKYQVRAGLGNTSTSKIVEYLDLNANVLASVQTNGEAYNAIPDAATNTIVDVLTLHHFSSASPSAGFGAAMRLRGKTSTSDAQNMARLYAAWETPTHATRAASVVLSAYDFSGEKKIIEGGVTGASTPKIGFLGITPQPRLAISGDHQKNPMTKQIVEALALFGLVTDATTDVEQFVLTGETGSWPLLQSFVDGLVTFSDYFVDTTSAGDCELVCEVPPPELWCKEFDFTDEDDRAPWVIERGQVGTGFESTMIDEVVFIHTAQFETFRIISVTIFYNQSSTTDATILFGAYDFAGYISHDWGNVDAGTGQQVLIDFSPSYDAFSGFRIVATSTDPAQQVQITGLKVEGYDMGIYGVIEAGTDCP